MITHISYLSEAVLTTLPPREMPSAALDYAENGFAIFPCKPGGKQPLTKRGFHDATTDPHQITAWSKRHPGCNWAIPTGRRNRLLVLDVDPEDGGAESLARLEATHGKLPATARVKTGGGGVHLYFLYPESEPIPNSAGKLGPGLDVRGEGGYVIVPPSRTQGAYERVEERPPAECPAWLLELLRERQGEFSREYRRSKATGAVSIDAAGRPPIPEGTRDDQLTRIAGKLHDGTRGSEALTADLLAINAARCVPPLPEGQVRKVARSIHSRPPCRRSAPKPDAKTLAALEAIEEAHLWGRAWPGMAGKSDRDALVALIKLARRHGRLIPAGVRVEVSIREWALATAVSKRAMFDHKRGGEKKPGIVSRLKMAGLIRSDADDRRRDGESGAFVLLLPQDASPHRATFHHPNHGGGVGRSGETLRAPRLRWSAPVIERVGDEVIRSTILRLGKTGGAVVDILDRGGGSATVDEIADVLQLPRTRDLRRRHLPRLEERGIVTLVGDTVTLVSDWLEALDRDREGAGEIAAHRRDVARYAREREAYRDRHRNRPAPAPTERGMRERREGAAGRRRGAIESAIASLFREYPEFRRRRAGQIACALVTRDMVPDDFPRGVDPGGPPKDREVEAILKANGLEEEAS